MPFQSDWIDLELIDLVSDMFVSDFLLGYPVLSPTPVFTG
jgi:hypothetical protein